MSNTSSAVNLSSHYLKAKFLLGYLPIWGWRGRHGWRWDPVWSNQRHDGTSRLGNCLQPGQTRCTTLRVRQWTSQGNKSSVQVCQPILIHDWLLQKWFNMYILTSLLCMYWNCKQYFTHFYWNSTFFTYLCGGFLSL